jgi:hypothetical protein
MGRILDLYCTVLKFVIALCLAVMVVLVFGNVVLRYGFNSGITTSEELSRWLLVWLTFLGAIVAVREHAHLGVDSLVRMLSPAGKRICFIVNYCLMLYADWLVARGKLAPDYHQHRRSGAGERPVARHLLFRRRRLRRLGRNHAALRFIPGRLRPCQRGRPGRGQGIGGALMDSRARHR